MSSVTVKTRQIKKDGKFNNAVRVAKDAPIGERGTVHLVLDNKIVDEFEYLVIPNVGVTHVNKEMPNVVAKMANFEGNENEVKRWDTFLEDSYFQTLSHEEIVKKASYIVSKIENQYVIIINSRFPYYEHVKYNMFKNKLGRSAFDSKLAQYFVNYVTVNIVNTFFSKQEVVTDENSSPECDSLVNKSQHKNSSDLFFYICHQAMLGAKEELSK
jgi:hypothetical protein